VGSAFLPPVRVRVGAVFGVLLLFCADAFRTGVIVPLGALLDLPLESRLAAETRRGLSFVVVFCLVGFRVNGSLSSSGGSGLRGAMVYKGRAFHILVFGVVDGLCCRRNVMWD
jgi:hypothetical protein